jgi:hypothetical protein
MSRKKGLAVLRLHSLTRQLPRQPGPQKRFFVLILTTNSHQQTDFQHTTLHHITHRHKVFSLIVPKAPSLIAQKAAPAAMAPSKKRSGGGRPGGSRKKLKITPPGQADAGNPR